MIKKYKYDVAIAVAEEDIQIAQQMAKSLKEKKISYYLYDEQVAEDWGEHILKISLAKYGAEARFVLMVISKSFKEKYWASIESQIVQVFKPGKEVYILPLRIDDTPVEWFDKYIVFVKWDMNPDDIASKIKQKLRLRRKKAIRKRFLGFIFLITIMTAGWFFLESSKIPPDYSKYLLYVNNGDSLVKENKFDDARASYKKALIFNPKDIAASRKLALLDSADSFIRKEDLDGAKRIFELVVTIPVSASLSATALNNAGVENNPPFTILIRWNGSLLEIKISGGIPFNNDKEPYTVEGLSCTGCVEWNKTDTGYLATIDENGVKTKKLIFKDRLGQFSSQNVPLNPDPGIAKKNEKDQPDAVTDNGTKENTVPPADKSFADHIRKGDSLFNKEMYREAKSEYMDAQDIKTNDKYSGIKLKECDAKLKELEMAAKKNIPRVNIPAGNFVMGTNAGNPDDGPAHTVNISSFSMSKTEITVEQYRIYCQATGHDMPPEPPYGWHDKNPVVNLTWGEANAYCEWVGGSLPTEAQWEYAAHGGAETTYSGSNQVGAVAWYTSNAGGKPGIVSAKSPNGFGLYDMTGNVWEWCRDWYDRKYYNQSSSINPSGPASGAEKVIRGGAYNSVSTSAQYGNQLRISYRNSEAPSIRQPYIGFRVSWNK